MTPITCAKDIAEVLQDALKNYKPSDPKVAANKITIRDGFLPRAADSKETREKCPSITIRPTKVEDKDDNNSTVGIDALVMIYDSDKENGHAELYNLLEFIRQVLLKNRTIKNKHRLIMPVKTIIPEDQPWPCWWGAIELIYELPQPQENLSNCCGANAPYGVR